jgi:hypothetical protein
MKALSSRKHLRLGVAMELALSVTTVAGSALLGLEGLGFVHFLVEAATEAT